MRRIIRLSALCVLAAITAASLSAGSPATATTAQAKADIRDNDLRDAILARFAKSKSAADHFQVHVQGRTATITGRTDIVQHKASATRMAKSAGAQQVLNNIQVSAAGKAKASEGLRRAGVHRSEAQPRSERSETR
jgi:hypothetical protein